MSRSSYEILLMEYAAGTLDLAQRMIIAAHLSLSPQGRKIVQDCECLGGTLMEKRCEPVPMSEHSLHNVMERLDRPQQKPQAPQQKSLPEDAYLPHCVQEIIVCRIQKPMRWRSIYPGIDSFALPLECRSSRAHVLKMHPGITTPRHRHRGLELTLVLNGAMRDEQGMYEPGSLLIHDTEDPEHTPASCAKHGAVCLTVMSGSRRFASPLAQILGAFLRM